MAQTPSIGFANRKQSFANYMHSISLPVLSSGPTLDAGHNLAACNLPLRWRRATVSAERSWLSMPLRFGIRTHINQRCALVCRPRYIERS